jgi:hypothetical protein
VIGAEQIDFGKAARKTYLKDKGQAHLAAYTQESVNGDYINLIPMYTKTVVAVQFHPDGEPYAVFAAPEMMHPITKHRSGMAKLAEIGYAFLEPLEMNEAKVAGADVTAGPTAPLPSNTNSQAPARDRSHSEPSF